MSTIPPIPIPAILQRYVTKTKSGPILWLGATATAQLAREITKLEERLATLDHNTSKSCPNVVTSKEGTSYCALAESSVKELTKDRDALRKHADAMYDAIVDEQPKMPPPPCGPLHAYRTAFPKQP